MEDEKLKTILSLASSVLQISRGALKIDAGENPAPKVTINQSGDTLNALISGVGDFANEKHCEYFWKRASYKEEDKDKWEDIPNNTGKSYTLTDDDSNKYICVRVRYEHRGVWGVVYSAPFDNVPPTITSVTIKDNTEVTVTFSEPVYSNHQTKTALEKDNFALSISGRSTNFSSTIDGAPSTNDNRTYTLKIKHTDTPNGAEKLTVQPAANAIFDAAGNAAATNQSNNEVRLHPGNQDTVFDAAQTVKGEGTVTISDPKNSKLESNHKLAFSSDNTLTDPSSSSSLNWVPYNNPTAPNNEGTYYLYVGYSDNNDTIVNRMSPASTAVLTVDNTAPTITSVTIDQNNTELTVAFSEPVYSKSNGTGVLQISDFVLSISNGSATLADDPITGISEEDKHIYKLDIALTGTPDAGQELMVQPAAANAIYDAVGNAANQEQANNNEKNSMTF